MPIFTTSPPALSMSAGNVIFPSEFIKAAVSASYEPSAFIFSIVLLMLFKSSASPFLTAIAYSSDANGALTIFKSLFRFTISFATSSSNTTASHAPFLRSNAASTPVLNDLTLTPCISSDTYSSPVVPACTPTFLPTKSSIALISTCAFFAPQLIILIAAAPSNAAKQRLIAFRANIFFFIPKLPR